MKRFIGRVLGFEKEISELHRRIEELSWDEPFGMWTRTAFLQFCVVMPRGKRVVVFIDLDDINGLNHQHGYTAVDEMVKSAFSISFRRSDIVTRWYSGDEIAILFDSDYEGAIMKINDLQKNASRYHISFQHEAGIWEIGKRSIIDVIDELANKVSARKLPRESKYSVRSQT